MDDNDNDNYDEEVTNPGIKKILATMLRSVVSTAARRRLRTSITGQACRGFAVRSTPEQIQDFQRRGLLDDRELTNYATLHELQVHSCEVYAQNELFGTYSEHSKTFEYMTYQEYADRVDECRRVLRDDLGIQQFEKVAIIANNRWEWATVAAAAYSLNASLVPMYEAQLPADWTYILNDSGASTVLCATEDIFDKVRRSVLPSTPHVRSALCLDAEEGKAHAFATYMAKYRGQEASGVVAPTPEDLADLIYTSGTTGKPKGVELTHDNLAFDVYAGSRTMAENPRDLVQESDRSLAFLPWAHSYGQTCELWTGISMGASMGICRGVPKLLEDLPLVQPTVLFAVPTLYKKIYDGVHNLMESASPLRRNLMKKALALGEAHSEAASGMRGPLSAVERAQFALLDKLVLSKIRDRFGGELKHGYVAGAACPTEVLKFMDSISIPVYEGYGLTETSPIITVNVPGHRSFGSVGRAIGGVDVYCIDPETGKPVEEGQEGEICCVGRNVMRGYYNNKEATDEVISIAPDGKSRMFHTGDLGRMDSDGWVRVTGRLKEQYKLENGKYVVPTPIEEAIGMSRYISQVVLCGANRPYNIALLVPEWTAIRSELKISDDVSEEDLANDESVKALLDTAIADSCRRLKKFEVPAKWALVSPFTAANNMLTPKMSIRRHKVMQAYEDVISHLYGDDPIITEAADGAHHQEAA